VLGLALLGCTSEIGGPLGGSAAAGQSTGGSQAGTSSGQSGAAAGGASGTGGTSGAAGAAGTSGTSGVDPTDPTLHLPFARLTRAEYRATILSAFGVEVDLSEIPEDGRIGRFTSNIGVFPDPVQPYLFAAEAFTAELIPSQLPACGGAAAASCIESSYRAPIERLYRRALLADEVSSFASLITGLEANGATAAEATRAAIVFALTNPDFIFRSMPVAGDTARARRLAEQLSYTLWDAPPDPDLTGAVSSTGPGDLGQRLREQAARLSTDERAVAVLARFLAQWLKLDLDDRLREPSFGTSPLYAELLFYVRNALATNVPVTSFVNGKTGFVHQQNAAIYGVTAEPSSGDVAEVTWADTSPRRGLVTQEVIADASRHPNATRSPIFRGLMVRVALLCDAIAPPPAEVVDLMDEVEDRLTDGRCAGCHSLIEPIGRAFGAIDPGGMVTDAVIEEHPELAGTYANLPALLDAIAGSRTFATCFARNLLGFYLEQSPEQVNSVSVSEVAAVVEAGGGFGDVLAQTVASISTHSQAAVPWCSGP
jgi:hypothetical protein